MAGNYKIPFSNLGMQVYPNDWTPGFTLVDNFQFTGTLKLIEILKDNGRPSFHFKDELSLSYFMFPSDMEHLLKTGPVNYGEVFGVWTFVKRGKHYGVRLVERVKNG